MRAWRLGKDVRSLVPGGARGANVSFPDRQRPLAVVGSLRKTWKSLRGKKEFDSVFDAGNRQTGRYFTLFLVAGTGGGPRLGLIVSKKVARAATRRNMIKRIVRESFRHADLARCQGFDLVVLARPSLSAARREEIRASIDRQIAHVAARICPGKQT